MKNLVTSGSVFLLLTIPDIISSNTANIFCFLFRLQSSVFEKFE